MKLTSDIHVVGGGYYGFDISGRLDCHVYVINSGTELAIVDPGCGIDRDFEKIISNIQEIKSRKGKIIIITDSKNDKILKKLADDLILIPKTNHYLFIVLTTIVLQLFAYYIAVAKKLNVDQPRNLAKSVTVE